MSLSADAALEQRESAWRIFLIFLRLGLTSFGGPVAHLGYFRAEFVARRRWLSERSYADLVAFCQFLPGPASSQAGMVLGLGRGGYGGAIAAWAGFTLPSAIAMILLAEGLSSHADLFSSGALHGLKIVAVAVVAQAVWGMARSFCGDAQRVTIMALAACIVLLIPSVLVQMGVMAFAGLAGLFLFSSPKVHEHEPLPFSPSHRAGIAWLTLFFALLVGLPILAKTMPGHLFAEMDAFYRAGSLVFGGGHVVLPLLQAAVVPSGWVSNEAFLAGYGAAQALPGPLFTFAAFLGGAMNIAPSGWIGGMVCLLAIFAPSFFLVMGALPVWESVRRNARTQSALAGINAAVVGLLLAALYRPVWTSTIHQPQDFVLALVFLVALIFWKLPPWLVVVASGVAGLWL